MPTEMFCISLNPSDGAKANINIKAGQNEHHKIEAIFKFRKAIKVAVNAIPKNDFTSERMKKEKS
jgi:imidazoleglycerol phosphate dehydratase HisB